MKLPSKPVNGWSLWKSASDEARQPVWRYPARKAKGSVYFVAAVPRRNEDGVTIVLLRWDAEPAKPLEQTVAPVGDFFNPEAKAFKWLDLLMRDYGTKMAEMASAPVSAAAKKSSRPTSAQFRSAVGGPVVGEKILVLTEEDVPENRTIRRIVGRLPGNKWEIVDTYGEPHVINWEARENPRSFAKCGCPSCESRETTTKKKR